MFFSQEVFNQNVVACRERVWLAMW